MVAEPDPQNIDVVILCGGMGTRLKAAVKDKPKPMAEVDNRPFLDILIDYAYGFGFKRFILCTGYLQDIIRNYYSGRQKPYDIVLSEEDKPLGTGGGLKNAERFIRSDPFLVMNGDSFCRLDLRGFIGFHAARQADLSLVLSKDMDTEDYGAVVIDDSDRIIAFNEKAGKKGGYFNAGVYSFSRGILSLIPSDTAYSLEYELFPKSLHKRLYGYVAGHDFIDIGTPERYERACKILKEQKKEGVVI